MAEQAHARYVINPSDYKRAIAGEVDFYLQFHSFDPEVEAVMHRLIQRFLDNYDLSYLREPVISIVKELVANAIKANLKRLFFKQMSLDITKTDDYRVGMETFKDKVYGDERDYLDLLERSKLVVRVAFKCADEHLYINVINNVPILDPEVAKINARVKKAYTYNDIAEAFDDVLDDSEGAGLGLIIAMMIFKNTGLPHDSFRIYRKNDLTIAAIAIPQSLTVIKSRIRVAEEVLKELEDIPAFPENIVEIQRLCADPEVPMKRIAESISRDPGLTTNMLKLANSAGYITSKKVQSIEEAAKIIGVRGINTLLLATGVHRILDARYKRFESIWDKSFRRAFYAQKIAIQLKETRLSEFAYLAALLSDIGYVVLLACRQEVLLRIREMTGTKDLADSNILEELSLGISHATLGGMICRKWNFNDSLVKAIEYHHRPHLAPENLRQLVYIVYLADCMVEMESNRCRFELIDEDVLAFFNIASKAAFDLLFKILRDSYTAAG